MQNQEFSQQLWEYYQDHSRDLPWRDPEVDGSFDAYKILVSEIMLQQTQVNRVIPKYEAFITQFPTVHSLATATLSEVLKSWSGLGYNRRAKYLHEAAQQLISKPQPWNLQTLMTCKGIGLNTAAAVCVYAYNEPHVFIETNIRTVFIHHFFGDSDNVSDVEIIPLVQNMLDTRNPREFYWAIMDYGAHIKATLGNVSRASKHYTKQSKFAGSKRQLRGQVLKMLAENPIKASELISILNDTRVADVLADLEQEKLISRQGSHLRLG